MKIGILEAGLPPEELDKHAKNFITRTGDEGLEFEIYTVLHNQFPESIHDCDGWMISGSRHGVYENLPWMLTLQDMVRDIRAAGLPLVGICFGHQIIAEALGGLDANKKRQLYAECHTPGSGGSATTGQSRGSQLGVL